MDTSKAVIDVATVEGFEQRVAQLEALTIPERLLSADHDDKCTLPESPV